MATRPEGAPRNNAQIALVAGLLIALLVVVYFVFLRSDGDEAEPTAASPTPVTSPVETEPETEPDQDDEDVPGQGPVETFEVFAARDPFEPLVTQPTSGTTTGTDTTGGTGTDGTGTDGTGTDGTGTDGTGTDGTGTDGTGGQDSSGQNIDGHRVKLVDVFTKNGKQKAQVQVDSTVYTVDEGETFADNFKLLSVSGQCASLLFGDDQFTLCEGEEILK